MELELLRRLEALYDAGGAHGHIDPLPALKDHLERDLVFPWLRELEGQGLVDTDEGLVPRVRLSASARAAVESARQARTDRSKRRVAARRGLLGFADEHSKHAEHFVNATRITQSPYGHFLGEALDWHEIVDAATHLDSLGLIVSRPTRSQTGTSRVDVAITEEGQRCMDEFGGDTASYSREAGGTAVASSGIDKRAVARLMQDIQKEFDKHPVKIPIEGDAPGAANVTNYYGPVIHGDANGAQLAWGNDAVHQSQTSQIAPGFEPLATAVAETLRGLGAAGLSDDDEATARGYADEILVEVTKSEPERGKLQRAVAALKGLLAPVALGLQRGAGDAAQAWAKTAIAQIDLSG